MTTTDSRAAAFQPPENRAVCRIGARGVSRHFGPVRACADVTLEVRPGTVHAVVGENGAGKSTLMKILYGLEQPDGGTVVIDDEATSLSGPRHALDRGIGIVQQELAIIPELSLLENLTLGAEPATAGKIRWGDVREAARELEQSVGVSIDWESDAAHAPVSVQQQVEILRLIYRGADVLILDEPTAALAPQQADELLVLLGSLRDEGRTIIFISHKLDEVIGVADRITVLRSGRTVGDFQRGELDRNGLASLIIGDGEVLHSAPRSSDPGEVVLKASQLSARDDRGIPRLFDVDLSVRAGEIVGVAAVAGNGQEELAEALIGIRLAEGEVELDGKPLPPTVRERRRAGMAYVSSDRKHEGLALTLSLSDNAIATPQATGLGRWGLLRSSAVKERTHAVLKRAEARHGSFDAPVSGLSGGNQQRVVLGRETLGNARVVIASQPTRGVDVRGIGHIHELLRRARDEGVAILLFSEELNELRELSDRIVVLHAGRLAGELPGGADRSQIGALMLGRTEEEG